MLSICESYFILVVETSMSFSLESRVENYKIFRHKQSILVKVCQIFQEFQSSLKAHVKCLLTLVAT